MRLAVLAIGHLKRGPEADLVADYSDRLKPLARQLGFKDFSIDTFEAPRGLDGSRRQAREAELLLDAVPAGADIFVLDERGKALSSKAFADLIATRRDAGSPAAAFLIGGADGHGDPVRTLVDQGKARALSFGAATWPHMLARVMLCEQLYRAATILSGHPYHRA